MSTDLSEYLPLREAAKLFPPRRQGKPLHPSTLRRWMAGGCRGVVLRSAMVGAVPMTKASWCEDFILELTAQARGQEAPAIPVRSARREAELAQVEDQLDRRGVR